MKYRWAAMMLCAALAVIFTIGPASAAAASPAGFTGVESANLAVNAGLAWRTPTEEDTAAFGALADEAHETVYLAGNSGTAEANVSNLAVTVKGAGRLTVDYAVACRMSLNYLLVYAFEPVTLENYKTVAENYDSTGADNLNGAIGWTSLALDVTEEQLAEDGTLTVYFAYVRSGTQTAEDWEKDWPESGWLNYAAISNVSYASGTRTDVVVYEDGWDETMGTVSAEIRTAEDKTPVDLTAGVAIGQELTLIAQPQDGFRFYGWIKSYDSSKGLRLQSFESGERELAVSVDETSSYTPVFAAGGTYAIRNGTAFYEDGADLAAVLLAAYRGDVVELLESTELAGDVTIPSGVTLYIPFRAEWGDAEKAGKYHILGTGSAISGPEKAYVTLTVPEDAAVTVNGALISGSVISSSSLTFQGHTSGAYGRIVNNGQITVAAGGLFTTWGITDGTGAVLAKSGAEIKEPFTVCDFSGGNNTFGLFGENQMPFKRYAMQNIQCTLRLERGGTLTGLCSLYVMGGPNETEISIMGQADALFLPNDTAAEGVILERTYDPTPLSGSGVPTGTAGIGSTVWRISGGLSFQNMTLNLMSLVTIGTEDIDFPIPYNMEFILENGTYEIPGRLKLMPGARVTVAENARLDLTGRLLVLDGLKQGAMSGRTYPSGAVLAANGLPQSGVLVVNGTLHVAAGATLGGVVQTAGSTGMLIIEEGACLTNSGDLEALDPALTLADQAGYTAADWIQQDGGLGGYSDNTVWFNLPARICTVNEAGDLALTALTPGVYRAAGADSFTLESYTVRWCSNGAGNGTVTLDPAVFLPGRVMTLETVALNQAMTGVWSDNTAAVEVEATTPYGEDCAVNVTVVAETTADGTQCRLTISCENKDGSELTRPYVHLVKYQTATGESVRVAAEADGTYLVPIDAVGVTVESALLGDVSLNGKLAMNDVLKLLSLLGTDDELTVLVGDMSGNGKLAMNDIMKLLNDL